MRISREFLIDVKGEATLIIGEGEKKEEILLREGKNKVVVEMLVTAFPVSNGQHPQGKKRRP